MRHLSHHRWHIGVGLGAIFIVFSPVLFFGRAAGAGDMFGFSYPAFYTFWQALRGAGSVLWDTTRMGGFPLSVGQYGGLGDPVSTLLFSRFSFFNAYHARVFIDALLAFGFAYAFLWLLSRSRTGALIGSTAYLFSQFYWQNFLLLRFSHTSFVIP